MMKLKPKCENSLAPKYKEVKNVQVVYCFSTSFSLKEEICW